MEVSNAFGRVGDTFSVPEADDSVFTENGQQFMYVVNPTLTSLSPLTGGVEEATN